MENQKIINLLDKDDNDSKKPLKLPFYKKHHFLR